MKTLRVALTLFALVMARASFAQTYNRADMTGDGVSDLVVLENNYIRYVTLNGTKITSQPAIVPQPLPNWYVVATGDFNQDLRNDIVLQNSQTRQIAILFMGGQNNIHVQSSVSVSPILPPGWTVNACGDFNSDGWPDLVVENASTGQVSVLTMQGALITGSISISQRLAIGWNVVGADDFDGDGKPDLVVQNPTTHQVSILTMDGTRITASKSVYPALPDQWTVVAVGDYDGDGKPDLVVQNGGATSLVTVINYRATTSRPLAFQIGYWNIVGPK